jgi:hypothetical protein
MRHEGRLTPVRRLLHSEITGEPVTSQQRFAPGCVTMFCVNPNHTRAYEVGVGPQLVMPVLAETEATVEDCVDLVYMHDEPWDARAIAEYRDLPLNLVEQAIVEIREGKW